MMWKRLIRICWSLFICTFFTQSLLTSIFALGWLYRWVQHSVTQRIFNLSSLAKNISWRKFILDYEEITFLGDTPNLCLRQKGIPYPNNFILKRSHYLLHSLWLNLKTGFWGIFTIWTLTAIPCILWTMSWYIGWHISFNKMYEESQTGLSIALLGIFFFVWVMLYLSLAQVRHAFTGDWCSFFDFRFVKTLVCHCPIKLFLLAVGYCFSAIILTLFKIFPVFFPTMNPNLESLSLLDTVNFLNGYYFYTGLLAFLLLFVLKTLAGRIYAQALVAMWTQKVLSKEAFHPREVMILKLSNFAYGANFHKSQQLVKVMKFPFLLSYKVVLTIATCLVWAMFSFLPFVSQFFNYYPSWGFLNQPLIQLPCFRYVPAHLQKPEMVVLPKSKSTFGR